jgi:hypothetical protein
VENKFEALNLSLGIKTSKKIKNFGWLDEKGCKAKQKKLMPKHYQNSYFKKKKFIWLWQL